MVPPCDAGYAYEMDGVRHIQNQISGGTTSYWIRYPIYGQRPLKNFSYIRRKQNYGLVTRLGFRPFGVVEQIQPVRPLPDYLAANRYCSRSSLSAHLTANLLTISDYPAFLLFYALPTVTGERSFNTCPFTAVAGSQHRIAGKAPRQALSQQHHFKFTPSESILLILCIDSKGYVSAKSTSAWEVPQ